MIRHRLLHRVLLELIAHARIDRKRVLRVQVRDRRRRDIPRCVDDRLLHSLPIHPRVVLILLPRRVLLELLVLCCGFFVEARRGRRGLGGGRSGVDGRGGLDLYLSLGRGRDAERLAEDRFDLSEVGVGVRDLVRGLEEGGLVEEGGRLLELGLEVLVVIGRFLNLLEEAFDERVLGVELEVLRGRMEKRQYEQRRCGMPTLRDEDRAGRAE